MKITPMRNWSPERMRELCIEQNWFTRGTCEEYDEMLNYVRSHNATYENMAIVASMILEHSACDYFSDYDTDSLMAHILFWIEKDVVITLFDFESTYPTK